MWIKFTKDIGEHKANAFADIEEPVARSFIKLGYAEELPADPTARAVEMALGRMIPVIQATAQQAVTQARSEHRAPSRPRIEAGQGGVETNVITPVASEVDKKRGFGNFIRRIIYALGSPDHEERVAAHTDLIKPWEEGGFGVERRTMTEGGGGAGGYTTPVLFEQGVFKLASEQGVIVPFAREMPLGARQVEYAALNQYSTPAAGQSAMFGGIQIYRRGETIHRTESDPTFKKVQLLAQDLTAYTTLPRDLVQDATTSIDGLVTELMGTGIGWREDWESILGNGAGQFLGYLNSPAALLITRNTGGTIVYQDVFKMKTRLFPTVEDPAWITHPYAMYAIMTLQDASGRFIFIPNAYVNQIGPGANAGGGITYKLAGTLLGWPIYTSEKVPPLGTTGDLSLVDRKKYWVGRRSGLEIGLSEHFLFDQDELAIRAKVRNDGRPGMIKPITLADGAGTNQVSGFVVLQ